MENTLNKPVIDSILVEAYEYESKFELDLLLLQTTI